MLLLPQAMLDVSNLNQLIFSCLLRGKHIFLTINQRNSFMESVNRFIHPLVLFFFQSRKQTSNHVLFTFKSSFRNSPAIKLILLLRFSVEKSQLPSTIYFTPMGLYISIL